jgi:hypothetical protein
MMKAAMRVLTFYFILAPHPPLRTEIISSCKNY